MGKRSKQNADDGSDFDRSGQHRACNHDAGHHGSDDHATGRTARQPAGHVADHHHDHADAPRVDAELTPPASSVPWPAPRHGMASHARFPSAACARARRRPNGSAPAA